MSRRCSDDGCIRVKLWELGQHRVAVPELVEGCQSERNQCDIWCGVVHVTWRYQDGGNHRPRMLLAFLNLFMASCVYLLVHLTCCFRKRATPVRLYSLPPCPLEVRTTSSVARMTRLPPDPAESMAASKRRAISRPISSIG